MQVCMYLITLGYGILCMILFYQQSIQPMYAGVSLYESDLPYHISMIIDDGWYYSFTAYAYELLYYLFGNTTIGIAIFLALVAMGTIFATDYLLVLLLKLEKMTWYTHASAMVLNLAMGFYIPQIGKYRYVSYQSGNLWHNSTYQCMKLFAIIAFIYYLKLLPSYYEKGINKKQWFIYMSLLAMVTGIKPSYLTIFAPIMAIALVIDLIEKVPFSRIFIFGSTVLPSLGIILWQSTILYEDSISSGIIIRPWLTFALRAEHAKMAVILSILFPLLVFAFEWKTIFNDGIYLVVLGMGILGFLFTLFLVEAERETDGNFLWGYCIAIFFLFVYSYKLFWEMCLEDKKSGWSKVKIGICGGVYAYQIYCGIIFFLRLVNGETYWMVS